ncbi:hypothetical protein NDA16_000467 [Ustilago loliicola]|nr:hypothetical protein NDA16_000467 [Ustilago loliicola]
MFSIKRFDAFGASSNGDKPHSVDSAKLDALNERILKKRKLVQGAEPSTSQVTSVPTSSIPSSASTSFVDAGPSAATALPAARPALNIHPSRLNAAPLLRQSVNKARTGPKEKTKAKQRYLKAKKERRKARIRAAPKKPKNDAQQAAAVEDNSIISHLPEEEALHRSEQAAKRKSSKVQEQKQAKSEVSSSSDSSSEPDSDSASGDDSGSESENDDSASTSSSSPVPAAKEDGDEAEQDADGAKDQVEAAARDKEVKALERFPLAGVKKAVGPKLIGSLGLPEGLSNRTVVNPTLSRPLPQQASSSKAAVLKVVSPAATEGEAAADEEMQDSHSGDKDSATISSRTTNDDFGKVALSDTVRSRLEALGVRSGKTLAYTVPIVEVLRTRQIIRLRALIVLPTRDLVSQVRSTLELIAKGSGLRIGTATGQHSFAHEQSQLVGSIGGGEDEEENAPKVSKVDILIATPGRLIDHLDSTPGFTLTHLRFLVIDEADRLLNQSFQEWLRRVLAATQGKVGDASGGQKGGATASLQQQGSAQAPYELLSGTASGLGGAAWSTLQEEAVPSVQKLLFSATLTRDPSKIAALGLRNPHYITVQDSHSAGDEESGRPNGGQQHERFSLPHSLREHMLVTTSADKPFHLLYLLHRPDDLEEGSNIRKALCFTKSVESAARLVKLIEIFEQVRSESGLIQRGSRSLVVKNYSSELKPSERQRILTQFGQGEIDLLVCSDLISRGIDLPSVEHVVSYDAPIDPAKYVHRVGRTARAGKHGDAWTLVEEQEARHFKKMVRSIVRQTPIAKIKPKKLKEDDEDAIDYVSDDPATRELRKMREAYEEALDRMAQFYRNQ